MDENDLIRGSFDSLGEAKTHLHSGYLKVWTNTTKPALLNKYTKWRDWFYANNTRF